MLSEAEAAGLAAENGDEFLMNDLDDLLSRIERPTNFGAKRAFFHASAETSDYRQRNVGFQERRANLAHGGIDVGLREAALAAEVLERRGQAVRQGIEHGARLPVGSCERVEHHGTNRCCLRRVKPIAV